MVDISEAEADMDIDKAAIIAALKDRQTVDPESMDPKILHRNGGTPVELPIASATLSGIRREGRDKSVNWISLTDFSQDSRLFIFIRCDDGRDQIRTVLFREN